MYPSCYVLDMRIAVALALLSLACGTPTLSVDQVTGTVGGQMLAAAEARLTTCTTSTPGATGGPITPEMVVIEGQTGICSSLEDAGIPASAAVLQIVFWNQTASGSADPTTSTYPIISAPQNAPGVYAMAFFSAPGGADASMSVAAQATGGTVQITSIDSTVVGSAQGTFTIQFGADQLVGSFHAPYCDIPSRAPAACP